MPLADPRHPMLLDVKKLPLLALPSPASRENVGVVIVIQIKMAKRSII